MSLSLPRPDNMDKNFGERVEHDMFMISDRVKELDPNLFIVFHEDREELPYVIMEIGRDGNEHYVFGTDVLDGRVIEKLEYLLHVPFEYRFAEAEKEEAKAKADREAYEHEKLYEEVGAPMLPLLLKTGAIDTRRESYPTRGVTGGKGSKKKSGLILP